MFDQRGELPLLPFGNPIDFVPASIGGVNLKSIVPRNKPDGPGENALFPQLLQPPLTSILVQIKRTYRQGDVQRARELSAVLYLEHYEKIEGDVFDKVPKLNEKVEPILGVKIRHLINTKAPPSEVAAQITEVLPSLR